ncbi:alpha/beta-hydrolase [Polychaeton citri CBS 116435]|uniref:Alpha/beta-hydrolase n=1 Tax=Polychaeton citri CBS 116435 TaxID=1314669 RepID=A0A9P4UKK1_9PEZI|nr:alpha/beta-hydrolase [Polychaeton citri CBS 116435]
MATSTTQIAFLQKLDIPVGFVQAIFGTILAALKAPFRDSNTAKTLKRHLLLDITRRVLDRLSTEQLQLIAGTTETNYLAWTKQRQLPARSVELPDEHTKAFWFGEPDADNLILYYHGGGWAMPGADGHFQFVSSLVQQAERVGKSISVLFLQYTLAPGGKYPQQITQAVEILRYSVTVLGRSPANIILLGDSSGANLVFGVLSHLMHPHPEILPLKLKCPLKGAMISSPVTTLNTESHGFVTQERQDPASAVTIRVWMNNILGSRKPDAWNQPLTNAPTWWSTLDEAVNQILITVASVEMMAEDTLACAKNVKSVYAGLTTFVSNVDFHAQCTIGPSLGMELGEAAQLMISWAIERC